MRQQIITIPLLKVLVQWIKDRLNEKSNTNHTHGVVTTTQDGFMTSADKTKLTEVTAQLTQTEEELNEQRVNLTSNPNIRPLVTFIDDDGVGDVYTKLKPIFESRGVPLTIAIITTHIGVGSKLTQQQLLELQNELGWEIASHSRTHPQINDLSDSGKEAELKGSLDDLKALGLNVNHMVFPYGYPNSSTRAIARKYYKSGVDSQPNNVMGTNSIPIKQYSLNRRSIGSYSGSLTLADYKQAVDKAIEDKSWLIFMTHIGGTNEQGVQDIEDTLDYVISKNVDVVTLNEGFEVFGNTLFQGDFNGSLKSHNYNIITKSGLEFKNNVLSAINVSSTIDKFPFGDTNKTFHRADNSGFPGDERGAGNLFTHRSNDPEDGFSYQVFTPYRTNEVYRRYTIEGGNWSEFIRIDYREEFNHLIGDLSTLHVQDRSTLVAAINELLGNLDESVLEIQKAGRSLSHITGGLKDLVEDDGVLYRLQPSIESDSVWIRVQVGRSLVNSGMELTAPGDAPRMRLYWKAQGEADAYITAWVGEEPENRYVGEIDSYTKQYSAVFDLSVTRTVTLSTMTAWGQEVRVWDFDWRVEA